MSKITQVLQDLAKFLGLRPEEGEMITKEEAIAIAEKAIEGAAKPQEGSPIETELKDGKYIVTFVAIWPPETLGPDYTARVTIDASSGEVLELLVGS